MKFVQFYIWLAGCLTSKFKTMQKLQNTLHQQLTGATHHANQHIIWKNAYCTLPKTWWCVSKGIWDHNYKVFLLQWIVHQLHISTPLLQHQPLGLLLVRGASICGFLLLTFDLYQELLPFFSAADPSSSVYRFLPPADNAHRHGIESEIENNICRSEKAGYCNVRFLQPCNIQKFSTLGAHVVLQPTVATIKVCSNLNHFFGCKQVRTMCVHVWRCFLCEGCTCVSVSVCMWYMHATRCPSLVSSALLTAPCTHHTHLGTSPTSTLVPRPAFSIRQMNRMAPVWPHPSCHVAESCSAGHPLS